MIWGLNCKKRCHTIIGTASFLFMGGLYIHIPFCRKKCIYCDFYSVGDRCADWHTYIDAIIAEIRLRRKEIPKSLTTVYFGGGTPSLMPDEEFLRLCDAIKPYCKEVEEFTIEVNPDDVTEEKLYVWKKGGVNRLSIGIQSFDDHFLKYLRRRHSAEGARKAFAMARKYFDNISIDLIFSIPGQTEEMWKEDLQVAISLHPEHISAYSLMYEEGTPLSLLRDRGDVKEVSEDTSESMMKILVETLHSSGYEHYEISNFALPGFRSRHNSSYWRSYPYLGIGPSAHSYDGLRCRSFNKSDINAYIKAMTGTSYSANEVIPEKDNDFIICQEVITREYLSDEELREEYVMIRLRTKEGIDLDDFQQKFGKTHYDRLLFNSDCYIKEGSLIISAGHLYIPEEAFIISDSIILALA